MKLNPNTSYKTYWCILKTFFNGRKIPIIPPILKNGELESDFKIKGYLRYKTILCHKVALDVQLINFLI